MCSLFGLYLYALAQAVFEKQIVFIVHISSVRMPYEPHRLFAVYNGVGSEKFTASELYRCPNPSYNEDVLRERSIA